MFDDFYKNDLGKRLKHPNIPLCIYCEQLKKQLNALAIKDVNPWDMRK